MCMQRAGGTAGPAGEQQHRTLGAGQGHGHSPGPLPPADDDAVSVPRRDGLHGHPHRRHPGGEALAALLGPGGSVPTCLVTPA